MAGETTNINILMDRELKERAESLLSEFGMSMTTAFHIFLRQMVRQGKIPFEISLVSSSDSNAQARKLFKKAFEDAQVQSVFNGTDHMTLDEINDVIAEARREQ